MIDQYTRTRAQLGTPALDALRSAHVAVFGIGGVGGQAVEVLARMPPRLWPARAWEALRCSTATRWRSPT